MKKNLIIELEGIFKRVFSDPKLKITKTTTATDINNWDSINHIRLIAEIEDYYQITFDTNEIFELKNVGDFIILLESKLQWKIQGSLQMIP